jgi:hypothetical protein
LEVDGCSLFQTLFSGETEKTHEEPWQICGDLARISIGYLSNTAVEQGCTNTKGNMSAGKLNCVHLIFVGT